MEGLKPGRIVYYVLTEQDAADVAQRRNTAAFYQGNPVYGGLVAPAMVVAVFGEAGICNLKVMLDGYDAHWATSREHNQDEKRPGTWHWRF